MKFVVRKMFLVAVAALAAGCASVAVTDDSIEQRTSAALGIYRDAFTISDRQDEGIKTTYTVKTKTGKGYNCYVTGTVTYFGRTVSDAVCTEITSRSTTKQPTGKAGGACNALTKAAGKC